MVQIFGGGGGGTRPAGPFTGLLFAIIGIACLGGAAFFGMKTQELLAHGLHAQGQVVDVEEKMETETHHQQGYGDYQTKRMMYYPVVKFDDSQHRSVKFTHHTGSSSPSHHKGDSVTVIYLEKDPHGTAIIDEGAWNWTVPGALGAMGLIFVLAGVWTILRAMGI
jgi:hypothetical protein